MLPSVSDIEQANLKAWPAIDTENDGQWVLRAAGGYTKRANSVQSLDPADDADAAPRLERAARWFRDRKLPPVFRVTPLAGPGILAELDKGWAAFDHSLVLAMDMGPLQFAADENTALLPVTSPDWLKSQQQLQGYDETAISAYMKGQDLEIGVDIGLGSGSATVYTCDLTHGYIDINGSYRS